MISSPRIVTKASCVQPLYVLLGQHTMNPQNQVQTYLGVL